jgi:hypothetical protein
MSKLIDQEFCEGRQVMKGSKPSMMVYQFGNNKQLVRVLTYEPGHAPGLGHNETPGSVHARTDAVGCL